MSEYIVKTETAVSLTQVEDLLCCALEGGSTYWCARFMPQEYPADCTYGHEAVARGADFCVWPDDDDVVFINNSDELIRETLQLMADKFPARFQELVRGDEDAETGDIFFQLLCFKEVVYG